MPSRARTRRFLGGTGLLLVPLFALAPTSAPESQPSATSSARLDHQPHHFASPDGAAASLIGSAYPRNSLVSSVDSSPADGTPRVGTITGTVRVIAGPAEAPPRLSPYSQQRYRPQAAPSAQSTVEDAVVYVIAEGADEGPDASIVQRDLRIIPRVTAITVGTEVDFPNEDNVFHNLFSLSDPKRFNLGRYPPGESESVDFDKPGIVRLFCDIHSSMSGVVIVLETPFFTRPAADGSYRIQNLPAGTHRVVAWHERAPPDTITVTVTDGRASEVDFTLGGDTR
jgi:plastocyanin